MSGLVNLLLFTRYPRPGEVKTRLIPALGATGAARLQRLLCEAVVDTIREFHRSRPPGKTRLTVCTTGADEKKFRSWLGSDLEYRRQGAGGLGERMSSAVTTALNPADRRGREKKRPEAVLLVGSDLPGLNPALLHQAAAALRQHDIVLGPARDGGYYLIGLKEPNPRLFAGIAWGTGRVLEQTRAIIKQLGLQAALLPPLFDIDRPQDLAELTPDHRFAELFQPVPRLSVIIPTLNEAARIEATIAALGQGEGVEVIVADGGSRDRTPKLAAAAGAVVLQTSAGRATQQNMAADRARGPYLLFLHADTLPPPGYQQLIRQALGDPATVAGAFRLGIEGEGVNLRLMEWGANLRSRLRQLPYGDQGLFMTKRIFAELGGFAELPIMEDYELVDRLRRRGRVVTLAEPVLTASRRWQNLGAWRTFLVNQAMVIGFKAGIAPEKLAALYRR
ncbi:TIGR04283 family arsenosugar biosynthesis glycosyltransferase [Desulfurivibrio sp. D14AmB]|uniref:TIGR04283 family arsenosugar biosynthesis glycosyltransferase n=1 Tax=Desulfurivibrio sp. D14AmB TaxID=3374370 RepID=UPI00376F3EAF